MRSLEKIRNQSFSKKSTNDWKEKAEQSLKGKTVESLHTTTFEKIILKPLYTREDELPVSDYPGGSDYRRGINPLGYLTNEWKVAQQISFQTADELMLKLHQAVEKGQTVLSFEVSKELIKANDFSEFYDKYPFALNANSLQTDLLTKLGSEYIEGEKVTGYIASDPISLFVEEGLLSEEYLQEWFKDIRLFNECFPQLRTVLINTVPYHNGGAHAVQELGIAIATGVFYLQQLQDSGLDLDTALSKMVFQFSIGSNFFMEVAKLRAARILWNRVTEVYGANTAKYGMQITASTSSFTKTVFDQHVNLLRTANEAFSAVLGGVQFLHVGAFDEMTGSNDFSERLARNIQLILKEESHLQKVIDPAGGSWYIESLTNQLAEKAWEFFKQIDCEGGILEGLKAGWLQKQISEVYGKRNLDIQTRKRSIVGTNVYAKLDEIVPDKQLMKKAESSFVKYSSIKMAAITQRRLAEPFEELRIMAKQFEEKTGSFPSVAMLCLGELKQHKARLDFMKGFLAAGGIKAIESKPISKLDDALQFMTAINTNFVCFCGANEQYELEGHQILTALKAEFPERTFFLAGLPENERQSQWMEEGIKQFIHVKSNCYETLSSILGELEVTVNAEQ
jgi:methylmalonyl-CoA mutase